MEPVPDFFQAEDKAACAEQIAWLQENLNLPPDFFAKSLDIAPYLVDEWRTGNRKIDDTCEVLIGQMWRMFLHLFSLMDFNYQRVQDLLEAEATVESPNEGKVAAVPWSGVTLRNFLENHGEGAITEVNRWATSFRFTDRYISLYESCNPTAPLRGMSGSSHV